MAYKVLQNNKHEKVIKKFWEKYETESPEIKEVQNLEIIRDNLNKIRYQNWFSKSLRDLNNYITETKKKLQADKVEWNEIGFKPVKSELFDKTAVFVLTIKFKEHSIVSGNFIPAIIPPPYASQNKCASIFM